MCGRFTLSKSRQNLVRWGMAPSWARDLKVGSRMINFRAESLADRLAFGRVPVKRRCLVLADGYYEWVRRPNGEVPMHASLEFGELSPLPVCGTYGGRRPASGSGRAPSSPRRRTL